MQNLPFSALLLPIVLCVSVVRPPAGADGELQNDELQTDLPAEVAYRSSYRDRQRHSRNAWTLRFRTRNARPTTYGR
jgi:hypothetical protein